MFDYNLPFEFSRLLKDIIEVIMLDIFTIIGLIIGFGGLLFGFLVEAKFNFSAIGSLIQPTAASIVFGGTIGAVLISFPFNEVKGILGALKRVFTIQKYDINEIVEQFVIWADKARKDGLLSLEEDARNSDNYFLKKGLTLIVDGTSPEVVRDLLERKIAVLEIELESSIKIFEAAGGFSPTMGVIGTVMGMVNILGEMGGDTNALAHSIAVAFIATLYGVLFANVVYLPFASRLKCKMEHLKFYFELIIEGLLSLQSGESPKIIKEKLEISTNEKSEENNK